MSKIYVDEIRHSGGAVAALSINSSGYVTTPNRPFVSAAWDGSSSTEIETSIYKFTAYSTSNQNIGSGGRTIIYKNDYNMLNTSTGSVTIPVSGIYLILGHYSAGAEATEGRRLGRLWVTPSGGSRTSYGEWLESYGTYDDVTGSKLLSLGANDVLEFGHNTATVDWFAFGLEIALLG